MKNGIPEFRKSRRGPRALSYRRPRPGDRHRKSWGHRLVRPMPGQKARIQEFMLLLASVREGRGPRSRRRTIERKREFRNSRSPEFVRSGFRELYRIRASQSWFAKGRACTTAPAPQERKHEFRNSGVHEIALSCFKELYRTRVSFCLSWQRPRSRPKRAQLRVPVSFIRKFEP